MTGMYPLDPLTAQKADAVQDCLKDIGEANYKAKEDPDSVWGEGKFKLTCFILINNNAVPYPPHDNQEQLAFSQLLFSGG